MKHHQTGSSHLSHQATSVLLSFRPLPQQLPLFVMLLWTMALVSAFSILPKINCSNRRKIFNRSLSTFTARSFRALLPSELLLLVLMRLSCEKVHSSLPLYTGKEKRRERRHKRFDQSE